MYTVHVCVYARLCADVYVHTLYTGVSVHAATCANVDLESETRWNDKIMK